MINPYSETNQKQHGIYASGGQHRRPRGTAENIVHIPSEEFCKQHKISKLVARRLHQIKKLISGIKKGGSWHYAIIPGCENEFEYYLLKGKKMRKPRPDGRDSTEPVEYNKDFEYPDV